MEQLAKRRTIRALETASSSPTKLALEQYKIAQKEILAKMNEVYAKILSGINPDDYYNEILKYERFNKLNQQLTEIIRKYDKKANTLIARGSEAAFTQAYYQNMYSVNWFAGSYFAAVPKAVVNLSVYGTPQYWAEFKKLRLSAFQNPNLYQPQAGSLLEILAKKQATTIRGLKDAITQGLINGKSSTALAKDIRKVMNTTASSALRIARTELQRNYSLGALANTQVSKENGIPITRKWLATLDDRTRDTHADLDGVEEDKNGLWYIDGDSASSPGTFSQAENSINCRCDTIDVIDGQDPTARAGRNPETGETEIADFKQFDEWAKENGVKRNQYGALYT